MLAIYLHHQEILGKNEKIIEDAPKGQPLKQHLEEDIENDVFPSLDLPNIKTR